jgi:Rps23 Pro-64 3,4-dihydroxylase Tpa1-like proline 4-hydroxylase
MGARVGGGRDARAALLLLAYPAPPEGPARHVVRPELFGAAVAEQLLDDILGREQEFVENAESVVGYRHGRVRMGESTPTEAVAAYVLDHLDALCADLGVDTGGASPHDVLEVGDLGITAHLGGDFLRLHRDDGKLSQPNGRVLSFVYWLHRRPCPFEGGELRLCGWQRDDAGDLVPGLPAVDLVPEHDMLAVFPSSTMHEILPVREPTGEFAAARFAVTGFICRRAR